MISPEHITDHLILLVGGNPLPDLVCARLLVKPEGKVWLLHSDGADGDPSTQAAAGRLQRQLTIDRPALQVSLEPISSSNSLEIEDRLQIILECIDEKGGSVGLNYTGGTKPMSVHTYRCVEKYFSKNTRPVYSYLDPRRLALRIDRRGAEITQKTYPLSGNPDLFGQVQVDLKDLAALHGYIPAKLPQKPAFKTCEQNPALFDLCKVLAEIHIQDSGFERWRAWIEAEKCAILPDPTQYPELRPAVQAMSALCKVADPTPEQVAQEILMNMKGKDQPLNSCSEWFVGLWLEEYGMQSLVLAASKTQEIHSSGRNLEYQAENSSHLHQ